MDKHTPDFQEQIMQIHSANALVVRAKDARIAELEAHQEYQLREEGALRDTIARLKVDLAEKRAKVERLRDVIADLIAGGESAEQADPRLGYIELQTDRETLTRAREALAATTSLDKGCNDSV